MAFCLGVVNQKGGVAKSTTTQNLAVAIAQKGLRVLIIDTDQQQTSVKWYNVRVTAGLSSPTVMSCVDANALAANIKAFSQTFDVILIDGAAGVNLTTAAAIRCSDLVLVPVPASIKDLESTAETVTLIHRIQGESATGSTPKAVFLMSRTKPRQKVAKDFDETLLDLGLPVLESQLVERSAYVAADLVSKAVVEHKPKSDAAKDILSILNELLTEKHMDINLEETAS
jgi:chromosome partitioning protein